MWVYPTDMEEAGVDDDADADDEADDDADDDADAVDDDADDEADDDADAVDDDADDEADDDADDEADDDADDEADDDADDSEEIIQQGGALEKVAKQSGQKKLLKRKKRKFMWVEPSTPTEISFTIPEDMSLGENIFIPYWNTLGRVIVSAEKISQPDEDGSIVFSESDQLGIKHNFSIPSSSLETMKSTITTATSVVEEATSVVEEATSVVEEATSVVEEATSAVEEATSAVEEWIPVYSFNTDDKLNDIVDGIITWMPNVEKWMPNIEKAVISKFAASAPDVQCRNHDADIAYWGEDKNRKQYNVGDNTELQDWVGVDINGEWFEVTGQNNWAEDAKGNKSALTWEVCQKYIGFGGHYYGGDVPPDEHVYCSERFNRLQCKERCPIGEADIGVEADECWGKCEASTQFKGPSKNIQNFRRICKPQCVGEPIPLPAALIAGVVVAVTAAAMLCRKSKRCKAGVGKLSKGIGKATGYTDFKKRRAERKKKKAEAKKKILDDADADKKDKKKTAEDKKAKADKTAKEKKADRKAKADKKAYDRLEKQEKARKARQADADAEASKKAKAEVDAEKKADRKRRQPQFDAEFEKRRRRRQRA